VVGQGAIVQGPMKLEDREDDIISRWLEGRRTWRTGWLNERTPEMVDLCYLSERCRSRGEHPSVIEGERGGRWWGPAWR